MARRLLARIATECRPPLPALAVVAQRIADVDEDTLPPDKLLAPLQRVINGERVG